MKRNKFLTLFLGLLGYTAASAQTLSLDTCRAMALRNNKQLSISRAEEQVAKNIKKAARTKYLPHVDIAGGYMHTSQEVSILSNEKKSILSSLGSSAADNLKDLDGIIAESLTDLIKVGVIQPQDAVEFQQMAEQAKQGLAAYGNAVGERIVDAFRTDTRNIFTASASLLQPIYMGGAITAANNMADIADRMSSIKTEAAEHSVLYNIDQTYWTVVSLNQKQRLADSYLKLVTKLDGDVQKMIKEGVATRADGLKVSVKVNEAEMTKTQVDNGLSLARMLLCQLCGLPLDSDITLVDEKEDNLSPTETNFKYNREFAIEGRPEVRLLDEGIKMTKQTTKMARAAYLPQVALVGGYIASNPNMYNGFEKKWGGMWNVGVMLRVPVLDWGDAMYKVRASKVATNIATLTRDEAKEMIDLQISQSDYKVKVASKKLIAAQKNIQRAEENLRCADLGFKEGVMSTTEVMAAQTAWFQAQTQKIDAQIDVKMSEAAMKKALGISEH